MWGIIADDGRDNCPYIYIKIYRRFENGRAQALAQGKVGIIDSNGNVIVPLVYVRIEPFIGGKALVYKDDLFGMIDTSGKRLFPLSMIRLAVLRMAMPKFG